MVGLGHLVDRLDDDSAWDRTLSGGEKQRLAFARIFLHQPDIVVLDEATSALDPDSQDKLMELLTQELASLTVVSVGHRPELEAFHSRKIVLERRRGGAKFVTDIQLTPKPRGRLIRDWLRFRTGPKQRPDGAESETQRIKSVSPPEFACDLELSPMSRVFPTNAKGRVVMGLGKGALLWLIGVPLPIIILLVLFWR
jgi:ABC-type Fe3+/spermidine/putrescine transport system ATPase subunit